MLLGLISNTDDLNICCRKLYGATVEINNEAKK